MKQSSILLRMLIYLAAYFSIIRFGGEWGRWVLYPLRILVCFLHESGHAVAALITGGHVDSIQINADGSGWTRSSGGSRSLTIMGGYIGSAVFGNLLFYLAVKTQGWVRPVLYTLAFGMIFSAVIWYNSLFSSGILILFALVLIWLAPRKKLAREMLIFIGLISIIYIIQDFNVGPSSDLEAYASEMIFLPARIWKYIWLGIVVLLFTFNLSLLFKIRKAL